MNQSPPLCVLGGPLAPSCAVYDNRCAPRYACWHLTLDRRIVQKGWVGDDASQARSLGMVIAVLCCGAFIVGIWEPLADGLDRRFPSRAVVGKWGSKAASWRIELDQGGDESAAVRAALRSVPEALAERVRDFGGRIIFTRSERLEHIRNLDEHDLLRAAGVYLPASRTAYISTDSEAAGQTGLHEVGHMLDHALGDLSSKRPFLKIYELVTANRLLSVYARSNPRECFADIFQRYYFSDRRRDNLAAQLPEAIEYMRALERPST